MDLRGENLSKIHLLKFKKTSAIYWVHLQRFCSFILNKRRLQRQESANSIYTPAEGRFVVPCAYDSADGSYLSTSVSGVVAVGVVAGGGDAHQPVRYDGTALYDAIPDAASSLFRYRYRNRDGHLRHGRVCGHFFGWAAHRPIWVLLCAVD